MGARLGELLEFHVPQPTAEQLAAADREAAARVVRERQERHDARMATLRVQGAPERLLRELGTGTETEAVRVLGRALERAGSSGALVVLAGVPGIGKTTAALRWLVAARGRPWFATARQWATTAPWDQPWRGARVAVLDDAGTEDDPRFVGRFDELVAHFHGQLRRMVITTNLAPAVFRERYGERVASRIRQAGGFCAVAAVDMRRPT